MARPVDLPTGKICFAISDKDLRGSQADAIVHPETHELLESGIYYMDVENFPTKNKYKDDYKKAACKLTLTDNPGNRTDLSDAAHPRHAEWEQLRADSSTFSALTDWDDNMKLTDDVHRNKTTSPYMLLAPAKNKKDWQEGNKARKMCTVLGPAGNNPTKCSCICGAYNASLAKFTTPEHQESFKAVYTMCKAIDGFKTLLSKDHSNRTKEMMHAFFCKFRPVDPHPFGNKWAPVGSDMQPRGTDMVLTSNVIPVCLNFLCRVMLLKDEPVTEDRTSYLPDTAFGKFAKGCLVVPREASEPNGNAGKTATPPALETRSNHGVPTLAVWLETPGTGYFTIMKNQLMVQFLLEGIRKVSKWVPIGTLPLLPSARELFKAWVLGSYHADTKLHRLAYDKFVPLLCTALRLFGVNQKIGDHGCVLESNLTAASTVVADHRLWYIDVGQQETGRNKRTSNGTNKERPLECECTNVAIALCTSRHSFAFKVGQNKHSHCCNVTVLGFPHDHTAQRLQSAWTAANPNLPARYNTELFGGQAFPYTSAMKTYFHKDIEGGFSSLANWHRDHAVAEDETDTDRQQAASYDSLETHLRTEAKKIFQGILPNADVPQHEIHFSVNARQSRFATSHKECTWPHLTVSREKYAALKNVGGCMVQFFVPTNPCGNVIRLFADQTDKKGWLTFIRPDTILAFPPTMMQEYGRITDMGGNPHFVVTVSYCPGGHDPLQALDREYLHLEDTVNNTAGIEKKLKFIHVPKHVQELSKTQKKENKKRLQYLANEAKSHLEDFCI